MHFESNITLFVNLGRFRALMDQSALPIHVIFEIDRGYSIQSKRSDSHKTPTQGTLKIKE